MPNTVTTPKGREIELFGSHAAAVSFYGIHGRATFLIYPNGRVEASAFSPAFIRRGWRPRPGATPAAPVMAYVDAYLDRWGDQRWTGNESGEMAIGPLVDKD